MRAGSKGWKYDPVYYDYKEYSPKYDCGSYSYKNQVRSASFLGAITPTRTRCAVLPFWVP